jgi:hypothetical protein
MAIFAKRFWPFLKSVENEGKNWRFSGRVRTFKKANFQIDFKLKKIKKLC